MSSLAPKLLFYFVPMVLSLACHEWAHAFSAHLLGDETAREQGRMTLNPIPHIDLFGTIVLPALSIVATGVAFYGWAKPTPINPARFRRTVRLPVGLAVTAAAGPLANVALGLLAGVAFGLGRRAGVLSPAAETLLAAMMSVNAGLAVFNLLPIPPLDGSRILAAVLPYRTWVRYARLGALAPMLIIAVIAIPAASAVVFEPASMLLRVFERLAGSF